MILFIDNYDSFSHNLARYIKRASTIPLKFITNDALSLDEACQLEPSYIVLSPGPGHPSHSGITLQVIAEFFTKIPILGICLGHQAIGLSLGAQITRSKEILHGKTSWIKHEHDPIFKNIANPFEAVRYHSLTINKNTLPNCLSVIASTDDEIMAIKHNTYPVYGFQFHPEAFCTNDGLQLIKNFFDL